eukprot:TRINITY_DN2723_c1_g1_i1.p1 TRINITY_DN2723_c1_g1~~TRINITY_DN2723_c1_g1_i1.p1  ORF type:complete len:570 (-),score=117.80 TRINITY_DN2723_c1_g1_i1:19-1728(-)
MPPKLRDIGPKQKEITSFFKSSPPLPKTSIDGSQEHSREPKETPTEETTQHSLPVSPIVEFQMNQEPIPDQDLIIKDTNHNSDSDFDIQGDIFTTESPSKPHKLSKLRRRDTKAAPTKTTDSEIHGTSSNPLLPSQASRFTVNKDTLDQVACIDHIGGVVLPHPVRHYDLSLSQDSETPLFTTEPPRESANLGSLHSFVDLTNDDDDDPIYHKPIPRTSRTTRSNSKSIQKGRQNRSTPLPSTTSICILDEEDDWNDEFDHDTGHLSGPSKQKPRKVLDESIVPPEKKITKTIGRKRATPSTDTTGPKPRSRSSKKSNLPQAKESTHPAIQKRSKPSTQTADNPHYAIHGYDDNTPSLNPVARTFDSGAVESHNYISLGTRQTSRPTQSSNRDASTKTCHDEGANSYNPRNENQDEEYFDHYPIDPSASQEYAQDTQRFGDVHRERKLYDRGGNDEGGDNDYNDGDDDDNVGAFRFFTPINRLESGRVFAEQFEKRPRMGSHDGENVHIVEQIMARAAKRAAERTSNPRGYFGAKSKQKKKGTPYRFWRKKGAKGRAGSSGKRRKSNKM